MGAFTGLLSHWGIALALRIFVASVLVQILLKSVVGKNRRTERFFWMYVWAALFGCLLWILHGSGAPLGELAWVGAIAFFMAGGTFLYWQAVHLSQSRTAIFSSGDDITTMILSALCFNELGLVNFFSNIPVIAGVVLNFLSFGLFAWYGEKKRQGKIKGNPAAVLPLKFYGYVLSYSFIWGVAMFMQRYWAFHDLPIAPFLASWYLGALLMAIIIWCWYGDPAEKEKRTPTLGIKDILMSGVLAAGILTSLGLSVLAYQAPQVIVQPILLVTEMFFPALIGIILFKERLDRREWFYAGLAVFGTALLLFGSND